MITNFTEEGKKLIKEYQMTGQFKDQSKLKTVLNRVLGDDYQPTSQAAAYHILYSQLES